MDLSAGYLLASFTVSSIGLGFFIYGKKELRMPQLVVGVAMMGYPYVVTSPLWIFVVAGGLLGGLWVATRAGL